MTDEQIFYSMANKRTLDEHFWVVGLNSTF